METAEMAWLEDPGYKMQDAASVDVGLDDRYWERYVCRESWKM